ncbi:MAG: hypothetical protein NTY83_02460 [Candidatus Micrarchaeota archaeon]|nr:hypothetical protein [Candidatus Micrarchaeota archaeon]
MGACWARGTTVGVGETVPLGGTTTTTTTTTNTTTTTTQEEGSSEPTPQMQITPADGSTPSSTEGSGWENLGMIGSGDSAEGASASGDASGTGGTSATAQQNQQTGSAGGSGCLPALVLAGAALSLFVFRP